MIRYELILYDSGSVKCPTTLFYMQKIATFSLIRYYGLLSKLNSKSMKIKIKGLNFTFIR